MQYCRHCMAEIPEQTTVCSHCGKAQHVSVPSDHLQPDTILHARYLIGTSIGAGGFGITYIAKDLLLDLTVAVKEFFPKSIAARDTVRSKDVQVRGGAAEQSIFEQEKEKILSEVRIMAKFSHEQGTVHVQDWFEENNTAYFVMEYLSGQTLECYLCENGRMQERQAYELLRPVMVYMTRVHQADLIHRDISPDNIMLTDEGPKLLDFGAARKMLPQTQKMTVILKHGYAPIEQYFEKGNQGPWTDVYAMCATMYRCLYGEKPMDALSRAELKLKEITPPTAFAADVSPAFSAVLMKGLALEAPARWQSFPAMIDAFDRALREPSKRSEPTLPPTPDPTEPDGLGEDAARTQPTEPLKPEKKKLTVKKKLLLLLLAVLLAGGACCGGVLWLQARKAPDEGFVLPDYRRQPFQEAKAELERHSVKVKIKGEEYATGAKADVPKGYVLKHSGKIGAPVDSETVIWFVISKGPEPVTIADLSGWSSGRVKAAYGKKLKLIFRIVPSEKSMKGKVLWQSVSPESQIPVSTDLLLEIGSGEEAATRPATTTRPAATTAPVTTTQPTTAEPISQPTEANEPSAAEPAASEEDRSEAQPDMTESVTASEAAESNGQTVQAAEQVVLSEEVQQ